MRYLLLLFSVFALCINAFNFCLSYLYSVFLYLYHGSGARITLFLPIAVNKERLFYKVEIRDGSECWKVWLSDSFVDYYRISKSSESAEVLLILLSQVKLPDSVYIEFNHGSADIMNGIAMSFGLPRNEITPRHVSVLLGEPNVLEEYTVTVSYFEKMKIVEKTFDPDQTIDWNL